MPPRIGLSPEQRTGAVCEDQLRGRLPLAPGLTVGESLAQWGEAEARAACWRTGYFELVGVAEAADEAWGEYANAPR